MTKQQHPITPPPELLQQWAAEYWDNPREAIADGEKYIAIQAARWGADQELEACVEWLIANGNPRWAVALQAARRPKPPSLAEQALSALYAITSGADDTREFYQDIETIKTALGRLQELEKLSDDQG